MPKKKETPNWYKSLLVVASFLLIIFSILICSYIFTRNYNPDKHVCTQVKHSLNGDIRDLDSSIYGFDGSIEQANEIASRHKCTKWRPKTICEINPTNDMCICDEYGRDLEYCCSCDNIRFDCENKSNWYCPMKCISAHLPPKPIKIDKEKEKCVEWTNETIINVYGKTDYPICSNLYKWCIVGGYDFYCETYNSFCCISKEKKNECEKNNPKYVWDNLTTTEKIHHFRCYDEFGNYVRETLDGGLMERWLLNGICDTYNQYYTMEEIPYKKFCRWKTLRDLSNKELLEEAKKSCKDRIWKDEDYLIQYPCYSKEEIMNEFFARIEKQVSQFGAKE